MFFNYLTLISALFISSVAIFYSVAGLTTIFAASVIPVIIMGTALEVGKLVVAVWLHKNWRDSVWWLKTYLSIAVIILMFITSMGIFGYLSKSHVEQTAADAEARAQLDRIVSTIAKNEGLIARSEEKIRKYETTGSAVDTSLQSQIDKEQERIATAYERIQPQIDIQLAIIKSEEDKLTQRLLPFKQIASDVDATLSDLQTAINNGEIKKAQSIAGTNPDGRYGPKTAERIENFRIAEEAKRNDALKNIEEIRNQPNEAISNAHQAINNLRATVQNEIDESNKLINRLRSKLGQSDTQDVEILIQQEQDKIKQLEKELDETVASRYEIEVKTRKLEAEVGPIKYIAEFIYDGEADKNILEEAVRWVIIVIIFVFDPLAVLLLIASQYSFEQTARKRKEIKQMIHEEVVEEVKHEVDDLKQKYEHQTPEIVEYIDATHIVDNLFSVGSPVDIGSPIGSPIREEDVIDPVNKTITLTLTEDDTPIPEVEFVASPIEIEPDVDFDLVDEPEPSVTETEAIREMVETGSPVEDVDQIKERVEALKEQERLLKEMLGDQSAILDEISRRRKLTNQVRHVKR